MSFSYSDNFPFSRYRKGYIDYSEKWFISFIVDFFFTIFPLFFEGFQKLKKNSILSSKPFPCPTHITYSFFKRESFDRPSLPGIPQSQSQLYLRATFSIDTSDMT